MKIGIQELLVIFIVALIVIGPDKLPYYAKKLGEAMGQFRKYTDAATKDIRESIVEPLEEAQKPLREAMEPFTELEKSVNSNVKDIQKSLNSIGKPQKDTKKDDAAVAPVQTDAGTSETAGSDSVVSEVAQTAASDADSQQAVPPQASAQSGSEQPLSAETA